MPSGREYVCARDDGMKVMTGFRIGGFVRLAGLARVHDGAIAAGKAQVWDAIRQVRIG